jgi:hypothetical protein
MSLNLDSLDRFSNFEITVENVEKVFEPVFVIKHPGPILAFDQTLGHTGWALLRWRPDPGMEAFAQGSWPRGKAAPGFEGNFAHADLLAVDVDELLVRFPGYVKHIVYEMPAVRGHRTDSSLMAATAVSSVAAIRHIPHTIVNARHARKVLTGSADATKAEVKKVIERVIPNMKAQKPFNTNVSDAAALGLVWMMENDEHSSQS